ncbi:MAG: ABC transporter ATP-binding protein [Lachnospiraceae bacterium]|nr:ABC transporter ATP-binding protein [Lachnospiraceae bacterium]
MIHIDNLGLILNKKEILSGISFDARQGEITGLVGDNGSGKTMIMKCICGFITTYTGDILVDGKNIRDVDIQNLNMSMLIENPGFISYYTGYKNLKCLADINGRIDSAKIKSIMEYVGLDPKKREKVSAYSLGMRQRLGIAQALMEDPEILILDEPFNSLDRKMCNKIQNLLLDLKSSGKTIILSSHNQGDIERLCDKVYEINEGKLVRRRKND